MAYIVKKLYPQTKKSCGKVSTGAFSRSVTPWRNTLQSSLTERYPQGSSLLVVNCLLLFQVVCGRARKTFPRRPPAALSLHHID